MKKNLFLISNFIILTVLQSCQTYSIPVESFKEQFVGIDSNKLKLVTVSGSMFSTFQYKANPIEKIKCFDKKGNPTTIFNSPAIEIRFTYGKNRKRKVMYFDRVFLSENKILGIDSRFLEHYCKPIPIDSITKIEIQDGGKNYFYTK